MSSSRRAARAFGSWSAFALLSACIQIPATNPYDEDTPPEQQVKATLSGHAAYPSIGGAPPEPPEGIVVEALRVGTAEPYKSVVTSASNGGRFDLEVPGGTYLVRASAGLYAPALFGPVQVTPGADIDVGALTLNLGAATASLSGRVSTSGGLSPAGVQVALRYRTAQGACGGTEAETTTGGDGSFSFEAVRPGRYAVVAQTEGATVDLAEVEVADDADVVLEQPLLLQPGTGVIQLEADGVRPTQSTRLPSVTVHVAPFADMEEMQLGLDPTFDPAYGATGWQPFAAQRVFDLVDVQDQHTVYVQLRSSCAQSPLYGARVVYDKEPPEVLSLQVAGREVLATDGEEPVVVIGDNRATVSVALHTLDLSGVAEVRLSLLSEGQTSTQVEQVEATPGQAIVRVEASLPEAEGEYVLGVVAVDRAGNAVGVEKAPRARLLRDFSPPSTPVPLVTRLEAAGPRAVLWLADQDCGGTQAPVCENNPHPDGLFEVRGGPALPVFTPLPGPPFEVEVNESGETMFEIRARDAGNQVSPGVARIEVVRTTGRTVFTAPRDKELGVHVPPRLEPGYPAARLVPPEASDADPLASRPPLRAEAGTALFSLRPRLGVQNDTYYSYLLAQPVDVPDLGLSRALSPMPSAIRKLSVEEIRLDLRYVRQAAGLGAFDGELTWLELVSLDFERNGAPRRFLSSLDGNGRFHLNAGVESGTDEDGEPAIRTTYDYAFNFEGCEDSGRVRCQPDPLSWSPSAGAAPSVTALGARHFATAGATGVRHEIHGVDAGTWSVTGPRVIGLRLANVDPDAIGERIIGLELPIEVPAGTPLVTAAYERGSEPTAIFESSTGAGVASFAMTFADGAGVELLLLPDASLYTYDGQPEILVGLFVPEGVTVDVPLVEEPERTGGYEVLSLIDRPLASEADAGALAVEDASGLDVTGVSFAGALLFDGQDSARLSWATNLSIQSWSTNREPPRVLRYADLGDAEAVESALGARRLPWLGEEHRVVPVATALDDALIAPPNGCNVLFRVREDVAVRGLRLEGAGLLDEVEGALWQLDGSSPLGLYEPATIDLPAGTFARPIEDSEIRLVPEDPSVDSCGERTGVILSEARNGQADVDVVEDDAQAGANDAPVLDSASYARTVDAGDFIQLGDVALGYGDKLSVTMSGSGDIDLYVRFNAPPSTADWDCRPYRNGSDEACELYGERDTVRAYIAVDGYSAGDIVVDVTVTAGGEFKQIASYPVTPGDQVVVTTEGSIGDVDLFVNFDSPPTGFFDDCYSTDYGSDEACILSVPEGMSEVYVAVNEYSVPASYTVTTRIIRPQLVALGSFPVEPGQRITVTATGTSGEVRPYVRFDGVPSVLENDCASDGASGVCYADAPPGATQAEVGVAAVETSTDFSATIEVGNVGCDAVTSAFGDFDGVLRAGRFYLLSLGRSGSDFSWPESSPLVVAGAPASPGFIEVLGSVPDAAPIDGRLGVPAYDPNGTQCRFELQIAARVGQGNVSIGDDVVAFSREEVLGDGVRYASVRLFDASAPTVPPRVVHAPPPGWRVLQTHVDAEHLYWIQADGAGLRPELWHQRLSDAEPVGDACRLRAFGADFEARQASFSRDRAALTGYRAGRAVAEVVQLFPDEGLPGEGLPDETTCGEAPLLAMREFDAPSLATALDDGDLFVWQDAPGTGGRLAHEDLRDLVPIHPAGVERPVGFDARPDAIVLSLASVAEPQQTRLVKLRLEDGTVVGSEELWTGGVRLQPRFVDGGVAFLEAGGPGSRPVLKLRPDDPSLGEIALTSATGVFAGVTPFDENTPYAWGSAPRLEASGPLLAVLAEPAPDVHQLLVYELPASPQAWAGMAPVLELPLAGTPAAAHVGDGVVVVTYEGGLAPATVAYRMADGLWREAALPEDGKRVVGALEDKVVVIESPGALFSPRPPMYARLTLREPAKLDDLGDAEDSGEADAGVVDADVVDGGDGESGASDDESYLVPADLFLHHFTLVARASDRDLLLFDETASPALLWRIDGETRRAAPDDGPHRPLTRGAESVGAMARPRAGGDVLYFLRRIDSGIALMRYRQLMP